MSIAQRSNGARVERIASSSRRVASRRASDGDARDADDRDDADLARARGASARRARVGAREGDDRATPRFDAIASRRNGRNVAPIRRPTTRLTRRNVNSLTLDTMFAVRRHTATTVVVATRAVDARWRARRRAPRRGDARDGATARRFEARCD